MPPTTLSLNNTARMQASVVPWGTSAAASLDLQSCAPSAYMSAKGWEGVWTLQSSGCKGTSQKPGSAGFSHAPC